MRRTLVAVTLASTLVSLPSSLLQPFWDFVSALWAMPAQGGCGLDPSGRCQPQSQPQVDGGCGLDPNGKCNPGS